MHAVAPQGATGMSTRGQSIAAGIQSLIASRVYPTCTSEDATQASPGRALPPIPRTATGSGSFVIGNLVAIAACLTTALATVLATAIVAAPQALAEGATGKTASAPVSTPAFVTPGDVRAGALLLKSENDRYV